MDARRKLHGMSVFWERAKVIVVGISLIITVLGAAYASGSRLSEIEVKLDTLTSSLVMYKDEIKAIKARSAEDSKVMSDLSARVTSIEGRLMAEPYKLDLIFHRLNSMEKTLDNLAKTVNGR